MENPEDGLTAQREAHNKLELDGKVVTVEFAKGKEREPGSGRRNVVDDRRRRLDHYDPRDPRAERSRFRDEAHFERYPEDYYRDRAPPLGRYPDPYSRMPPFVLPPPPDYYPRKDDRYGPYRRDGYRDPIPYRREERDWGRPLYAPYPEDYYRMPPRPYDRREEYHNYPRDRDMRDPHPRDRDPRGFRDRDPRDVRDRDLRDLRDARDRDPREEKHPFEDRRRDRKEDLRNGHS